MLPQVDVNWWAVLVGGIASMVLGYIWYMPAFLGNMWAKELGKSSDELKKNAMMSAYVMMFVAALVISYIMAHFVVYTGAKDVMGGVQTGFWIWLGFVATVGLGKKAFSGTSWTLYAIEAGYSLVQFAVIGAIVASWMK